MSYTFLAATGEASCQESFPEMFRCAPWKSTEDAGKLYYNAKEMAFCLGSPFGIMLKHSTDTHGEESQELSLVGSHAPEFHQPELIAETTGSSLDLLTKALDFGRSKKELLQRFNLNLCVLKTPRIFALTDLSPSCKTLTQWGMTHAGVCLDVADSVQIISESECSLLPTPTAHNSKEGNYPAERARNTPTLAAQVGGKINPDWNEWRMGCPTKWSDLKPLEIDKYQQWLASHGKL